MFNSTRILKGIMVKVKPLIWWQLANVSHENIIQCEMAKTACRASKLKADF